jgi:hypothetical protein
MSGARQTAIRALLKASDGMTAQELRERLSMRKKDGAATVTQILRTMGDAYIDRWWESDGKWVPVWAVVEVPEDCPKPDEAKTHLQEKTPQARLPLGRAR